GAVGGFIPMESYWSLPKDELQRAWPVVRGPAADEIARAKKLMADAGYKDGVTTTYMQSSTPTYEEQMIAIKKQLEQIGFKVNVIVRQYPAQFNEALAGGAYEMTGQPTVAPVWDPDVYLGMYVTGDPQNFGTFSDAQVDELYQRQSQTADREQRRQLVWQLQRRLMETVPAIVYVHREFTHAAVSQVRNYEGPRPLLYDNLRFEDVWLAQ
ncbi:MAG: ABC transporter substrate-binding protein, partial [Chloroflexota bacterium]